MVKHIILWKLKEEFNNFEIKTQMKEKLEGLMGKIDGLSQFHFNKYKILTVAYNNIDFAVTAAVIDSDDLKALFL